MLGVGAGPRQIGHIPLEGAKENYIMIPWFTKDLAKQHLHCKQLGHRWRRGYEEANLHIYKTLRKQDHLAFKSAKKVYFGNRIAMEKQNQKEIFEIIKSFIDPKALHSEIPPSQMLCNYMATYFEDKINIIQKDFGTSSFPESINEHEPDHRKGSPVLQAFQMVTLPQTYEAILACKSGSPLDACPQQYYIISLP